MTNIVPFSAPQDIDKARLTVEEALSARAEMAGRDWAVHLVAERGSHAGTFLFAAHSECGEKLAAKLYRRPRDAAMEYDGARAIHAVLPGGARPVCCDTERGLYVSTWLEGETLEDLLSGDEGVRVLAESARWLRDLHDRSRASRPLISWPTGEIRRLRAGTAHMPTDRPAEERAAFEKARRQVSLRIARRLPRVYRPVRLHGDYVPSNIIRLPEGGVSTLDFTLSSVGPREADLAAMTIRLATMAEEGPLAGTFDAVAARATFLETYGLTSRRARAWLAMREEVDLLRRWRNFARARYREPAVRAGEIAAIRRILAHRGVL